MSARTSHHPSAATGGSAGATDAFSLRRPAADPGYASGGSSPSAPEPPTPPGSGSKSGEKSRRQLGTGPLRVALALALLTVTLGLAACGESPEDRYKEAVTAASDAEDIEDYLLYFTAASAETLRGIDATAKRTGRFKYVDDIRKLLVAGEITEVEERGELRILKVADGKATFDVWMVQEGGRWVIDALHLAPLWKPLTESGEE